MKAKLLKLAKRCIPSNCSKYENIIKIITNLRDQKVL